MKKHITNATLLNSQGLIERSGLRVVIDGDMVIIGDRPHNRSDLTVGDTRITSKLAGWEVVWE